ncbi:hypothetical protein BJX63DRAFT_50340 [Aspergillus granulosus]|uniref:C2H2-type domain-containing protein n=1 Tax=Aspergillus granulosus TaxID=176169 RepID=A0ABR4GY64_9EURO
MNEPYGYDDQDSPGALKPFKPDLGPKPPSPPPFVRNRSPVREEGSHHDKGFPKPKDPAALSDGHAESIGALLRNTLAYNHPDIAWNEIKCPIAPPTDHSIFRTSTGLRGNHAHEEQKPRFPEPDLKKTANDALAELGPKLPPIKVLDDGPREPRLALITDRGSQDSLPALLNTSASRLPDNAGTRLPSLKTQLGGLGALPPPPPPSNAPTPRIVGGSSSFPLPPVSAAVSPPMIRAEPSPWDPHRGTRLPSNVPPSPYSHLSPASSHAMSAVSSPVSQSTYWRGGPKSARPYYESPSMASRSPATHYPIQTERAPPGSCEPVNYVSPQGNGTPAPAGTFKCDHPGCTAAPFQTQYLLNSHANVHSQDRPHFCPIEGCSRGPGGKGFKRKNEMIRHGLVHNSPGYVCPFCPDQQHKYPRPDNLQRHVRVHHMDKSKDDAALRHVLAQRPEGSGRGRRRRINPQ